MIMFGAAIFTDVAIEATSELKPIEAIALFIMLIALATFIEAVCPPACSLATRAIVPLAQTPFSHLSSILV